MTFFILEGSPRWGEGTHEGGTYRERLAEEKGGRVWERGAEDWDFWIFDQDFWIFGWG